MIANQYENKNEASLISSDMQSSGTNYSSGGNPGSMGLNSRIEWGAIIAGVILSLSSSILLNFLGIGLGLLSFDTDPNTVLKIGIGAVTWLTLSGILSMFIGGWATGMLSSNTSTKIRRASYGIISWGIVTLIIIFMVQSAASTLIGSASNIAQNILRNTSVQANFAKQTKEMIPDKISEIVPDTFKSDDEGQSNSRETDKTNPSTDIGLVSIVLFASFLLSAIAAVLGTIYGGRLLNRQKNLMV